MLEANGRNDGDENGNGDNGYGEGNTTIPRRLRRLRNLPPSSQIRILLATLYARSVLRGSRRQMRERESPEGMEEVREDDSGVCRARVVLPEVELRYATPGELRDGAMCRFCFEGSTVEGENDDGIGGSYGGEAINSAASVEEERGCRDVATPSSRDDSGPGAVSPPGLSSDNDPVRSPSPSSLVSPCLCSGYQSLVHVSCLRTWQRLSTLSGHCGRARYCGVCTAPFALRPPPIPRPDRKMLRRGTLLVETDGLRGGFRRTVVLLLGGPGDSHGNGSRRDPADGEDGRAAPHGDEGGGGGVDDGDGGEDRADAPAPRIEQRTELDRVNSGIRIPGMGTFRVSGFRESGPSEPPAFGVIINRSWRGGGDGRYTGAQDSHLPPPPVRADLEERLRSRGSTVSYRRGGPVCGGRLGLTEFVVLHSIRSPPSPQPSSGVESVVPENVRDGSGSSDRRDNEGRDYESADRPVSVQVYPASSDGAEEVRDAWNREEESERSLYFLRSLGSWYGGRGESELVGRYSFPSERLPDVVGDLVSGLPRTGGNNNVDDDEETDSRQDLGGGNVVIFSGFCTWGRGQLQSEVRRGSWSVICPGTVDDVLRDDAEGLWEELRGGARITGLALGAAAI